MHLANRLADSAGDREARIRSQAGSLKVAKCNDAACAGGDESITTVDDPANNVGYYTSLAIGADGLPVISYTDESAQTLKVAKCRNASCRDY